MMDRFPNQNPRGNQLNPAGNPAGVPGEDSTDDSGNNYARNLQDNGNPPVTDQQPRYSSGFTMIPPNESRRKETLTIAQKEEQDFARWRDTHRGAPVSHAPEILGGDITMAEARQKQFANARCSKWQKKLKKEEMDKKKRQEEEEENQRKKDEQRKKAERLEERKRQEDQRRKEQFQQHHQRMTDTFLQSLERRDPPPPGSSNTTCTSPRSETVENKLAKDIKDLQMEHKRVNLAFLDKLEGRSGGSEKDVCENFCLASDDFSPSLSDTTGWTLPTPHLEPDPKQNYPSWEDASEPDDEWALMKLMSNFPECNKVFLKDILDQCNNDYEQAYTLIISTLT
ncbi:uncharacterized protein epsti1 [Aulostomus maculatus]